MGRDRRKSLLSVESYAIASPGGSTAGLDQELSRFRRRVGRGNWQRPNATHRAEMVPTGLLRKPETLKSRTELLYDRTRGIGDGI